MQQQLKERLVGAAILVVIAVIFIPMLLTGPIESGTITETNIPERPTEKLNPGINIPAHPTEKFNLELIPIIDTIDPRTLVNAGDVRDDAQPTTEIVTTEASVKPKTEPAKVVSVVANPSIPADIVKDRPANLTAWVVQLGSFISKENAEKLRLRLINSGFPAFVESLEQNNKTVYRVRVGPELLRADADAVLKKIKNIKENKNLSGIVQQYP